MDLEDGWKVQGLLRRGNEASATAMTWGCVWKERLVKPSNLSLPDYVKNKICNGHITRLSVSCISILQHHLRTPSPNIYLVFQWRGKELISPDGVGGKGSQMMNLEMRRKGIERLSNILKSGQRKEVSPGAPALSPALLLQVPFCWEVKFILLQWQNQGLQDLSPWLQFRVCCLCSFALFFPLVKPTFCKNVMCSHSKGRFLQIPQQTKAGTYKDMRPRSEMQEVKHLAGARWFIWPLKPFTWSSGL